MHLGKYKIKLEEDFLVEALQQTQHLQLHQLVVDFSVIIQPNHQLEDCLVEVQLLTKLIRYKSQVYSEQRQASSELEVVSLVNLVEQHQ
jgi:hypothetical protein